MFTLTRLIFADVIFRSHVGTFSRMPTFSEEVSENDHSQCAKKPKKQSERVRSY